MQHINHSKRGYEEYVQLITLTLVAAIQVFYTLKQTKIVSKEYSFGSK